MSGNTALNIGSAVTITSSGDGSGTWTSDNPSAATIDPSTGVVSAVAIGNALITYTKAATPCSDATSTITLYVTNTYTTSGNSSNWSSTTAWGGGVVPPLSGDVVIANDINIDQNTNTLGTVTINPGVTLTVNSSRTMTATGLTLANGTLSVSGTYDANGAFDATSGTVTIGAGGLLALGDAVPSLGTFTAQASNSTVRYDQSSGGPQVIPVNAKGAQGEYETLEINGVNKELTGNTQVNTALNFEASGTVK